MSDLVPPEDIERLVGIERHETAHYGRASTEDQKFYILHSRECKDSGVDLRECRYSLALDRGILPAQWSEYEDEPTLLWFSGGDDERLVPLHSVTPRHVGEV